MKKGISKIIVGFIAVVMSVSISAGTILAYANHVDKQEEIVIYFTRHGKTMLNTTGRGQGWSDSPLTPAGIEVAEYLGKGLALSNIKFDKVYSSDSGRAIETAEIVLSNNGQTDLKINKDKRLREYGFGSFECMPDIERFENIAAAKNMTLAEYANYMKQNGMVKGSLDHADTLSSLDKNLVEEGKNWPAEDSATIIKRLKESVDDIVGNAIQSGDNSILVTSHGMSIVTLLYTLDPSVEISGGLANASVSKVIYKNGQYTIESVNDLSYVELGKNSNLNPENPNGAVSSTKNEPQVSVLDPIANQEKEIVIYFTRHGKTMLNTTGRGQGWSDSPLTPAGIEVAEYLGKGLAVSNIKLDKVYSSDSGRAIETAEIVLSNNGQTVLEINKDKRLREHGFGSFEGMPDKERAEYIANAKGITLVEYMTYMKQEGMAKGSLDHADTLSSLDKNLVEEGKNWPAEDSQTIINRLKESLDDIVGNAIQSGDDSILVTSHGMSIVTLLYTLDPSVELPSSGLSNASVSKVIYKNGQYTIESINDMSYVELGKNWEPNPENPNSTVVSEDDPSSTVSTEDPSSIVSTEDPSSTVSTEDPIGAVSVEHSSRDTGSNTNSNSTPKTGDISLTPTIVILLGGLSIVLIVSKRKKRN